jgi:hypothetical protein
VPILGVLPSGTPVAFEAAYGWDWLVDLLESTCSCSYATTARSIAFMARRGHRRLIITGNQGQCASGCVERRHSLSP